MEAFKEKTVGFLMIMGVVISVLSVIAMFMFAGAGIFHGTYTRTPGTDQITDVGDLHFVPVALFFFTVGLCLTGGGIFYALWQHKNRHVGVRETVPHATIIARYGYTKEWTMITADWELEQADDPHYFVRVGFGPGDVREFECVPQIYFSCGEGMTGEVEIQGKWLGKFIPYIGMPGK